ncbi:MAG: DUF6457 domain-containing protein [Actinomycetota bacterium]
MDDWIDRLAAALGEEPLSGEERNRLLDAARDVAHGVERKVTPLATFLLGSAVGRNVSAGARRSDAMDAALETLRSALPEDRPEGGAGGGPEG